ncbi:sugar ABC transporter permease [Microbacterium sp. STN6]|uniref:carbohydrate ABC transporter permease n=1 Tax=Microbacterium sp. STN6 TaxID=2995588 RepID=UPI0022609C9B|nr:sugar ABC transporter permease [Microbacterium sp. STN6]MCX7522566.1 sugar ABC transporter permease [Microbacterium sp. STN6]
MRSVPLRANLLYVPALIIFAIFIAYPLIRGFGISFTSWDGFSPQKHFIGVDNYLRLFTDSTFGHVVLNTFIYGVGSTVLQQVFGLGLALILRKPTRRSGILRAIIYLPALVSPVIMGTMYYLLFQYNDGALNDLVGLFGADKVAWLNNATVAIIIIVLVNSLQFMGISMVIYLAGLHSIPAMYYEASTLDGAAGWKQFLHITAPLLWPAFTASVVLNLINGLKLFDVITVLTAGGPGYSTNSVSTLISITYFDSQNAGYAASMGVVLFAIIVVFALIVNSSFSRLNPEAD